VRHEIPNHAAAVVPAGAATGVTVQLLPFHVPETYVPPLTSGSVLVVVSPTAVHDVGLMQLTSSRTSSPPVGDAGIGTSDHVPPLHSSANEVAEDDTSSYPVAIQNPLPVHETPSKVGATAPGGATVGLMLHDDPFHCWARV
jgi:hypothetical protein